MGNMLKGLFKFLIAALPLYDAARWMSHRSPKIATSYLWRVNATPPAYLFGTLHIDVDLLWAHIPQNAKEALDVSIKYMIFLKIK